MHTPRDKIRELRALLDEGLLSEQEFSQRKNAILDSEFAPGMPEQIGAIYGDIAIGTDLGFLAGQEVGGFSKRYRLERFLGQGGMGQVWLAVDLATQAELGHSEMVALKILPPQLTQSALHARLLIEEASVVRKLAHENIVRVYEWAQDPATSSYFIIMEYLDGQDLETYLSAHGPCSLRQVLTLLMPVAHALQYAWEKHRLVHRDLKPGNLLLTRQGDIKLLDFGISARLRSHTNPGIGHNTSSKPSTKMPGAGTAGYRAPEAGAQHNQFSPSLDVYAVAVMMLEMLTGALPFMEQHDHRAQQLLLAQKRPVALSPAQWQVLQSGFATDPGQRPESVLALLHGMAKAVSQPNTIQSPVVNAEPVKTATKQKVISPIEAAALQRAEQRRQRKELEEQRRQQASASLRALIAKQKNLQESERQDRSKQSSDAGFARIRIGRINEGQVSADCSAREQPQRALFDGADLLAAPIGRSLIAATTQQENAIASQWNNAEPDVTFVDTNVASVIQNPMQTQINAQTEADTGMSWEEAKRYLAWISQKNGEQVRMPSEAEWQDVCRTVSKKLAR